MGTNEITIERMHELKKLLWELKILNKKIQKASVNLGHHIRAQQKQIAWRKDGKHGN